MRKVRSDKGKPRDPFKIDSSSSDTAIKRMLTKVNSVIDTYRIEATADISNEEASNVLSQASSRVQNILTFGPNNEKLDLVDDHVPVTQAAVDYIRKVLKRQEDNEAKQKEIAKQKGKDYQPGKRINELLKDLPTLSKKLDKIQSQLADSEKYHNVSDGKLVVVPEGKGHRKAIWQNRATTLKELVERSKKDFSSTPFRDVIDKLYDDQLANADIIGDLKAGKWTGELMEEANLRVILGRDEEEVDYNF